MVVVMHNQDQDLSSCHGGHIITIMTTMIIMIITIIIITEITEVLRDQWVVVQRVVLAVVTQDLAPLAAAPQEVVELAEVVQIPVAVLVEVSAVAALVEAHAVALVAAASEVDLVVVETSVEAHVVAAALAGVVPAAVELAENNILFK